MTNYITFTQSKEYIYYFDDYSNAEKWSDNPENMVDGITYGVLFTDFMATTFTNNQVQLCNHNSCASDSYPTGDITKVEIRAYSAADKMSCPTNITAHLKPVFTAGDGDVHSWEITHQLVANWSEWFDITSDTNAPVSWTWTDVYNLDVDHYPTIPACGDPQHLDTAKIEIRVSCSTDCSMIVPEYVSDNHNQNIKMFNLWSGNRIVFGQSRSEWSLLLKGRDWENDACDKIECLKNMGLIGKSITLSGLNNINWDIDWFIKGIKWKIITECPVHYEWMILLERAS